MGLCVAVSGCGRDNVGSCITVSFCISLGLVMYVAWGELD